MKLKLLLVGKPLSELAHIENPMSKLEREENAQDFCDELRSLIDVHEVRGNDRHRMGQSLIGIGISCMHEHSGDLETTKRQANATAKAWYNILSKED